MSRRREHTFVGATTLAKTFPIPIMSIVPAICPDCCFDIDRSFAVGNSLCDHRRFGSAWRSTLQFGSVGGGSQFWWLFDIVDNATASYWYAAGGHTIPGESSVIPKGFCIFFYYVFPHYRMLAGPIWMVISLRSLLTCVNLP